MNPAPRYTDLTVAFATSAVLWCDGGLQDRQFVSPECHISFRHPSDWVVLPDTRFGASDPCAFLIRPVAWESLLVEEDSVDRHTITLGVMAMGFADAVPTSPFESRDSGWVVGGRLGLEGPADTLSTRGWRGVRGLGPFGCYRIGGGYVGACAWPTAMIGTETSTARLEGGPDDVFDQILATFEFRE